MYPSQKAKKTRIQAVKKQNVWLSSDLKVNTTNISLVVYFFHYIRISETHTHIGTALRLRAVACTTIGDFLPPHPKLPTTTNSVSVEREILLTLCIALSGKQEHKIPFSPFTVARRLVDIW